MLMWTLLAAVAAAKNPCAELKPKHKPDPATMKLAGAVLDAALARVGVQIPVVGATVPDYSAVRGNEDAKGWLLYQICTLKEAGMLSAEKAEEIVETVLVGRPEDGAPVMAPAALPAMTPAQAASRAEIVAAVETFCAMKQRGADVACASYRQMLENFDAQLRAVNGG